MLRVRRVARVTPHMLRITLGGDELAGFVSASFDDHVKLFFPHEAGAVPVLPVLGERGPEFPAGQPKPQTRDYTPRRYDADARELDIDFVLHGEGTAASWAARAQVGDYLGVAGPRGSFVIPQEFDWHLLIGDETALPAIARRVAELPAGKRVLAVVETASPNARLAFDTRADLHMHWVHGGAPAADGIGPLERVVRRLVLPEGEGYVWAAGESLAIRAVREYLVRERGLHKSRIRAASYWRRDGGPGHEVMED
ncbi:siderophore-interacting protein [Candidimonas nitroreducens]|uniref:NADPH-dependent ferric siderophore reductase n=1 Tax=Candidimonas nitroreducens TaxID=683354 RepID=A0A225M5R4_9BURK|nr:siderophore-interacting protein [Candidimonas nitroreducens]OWT54269.1 NADPH-dependent ferric siderophore reductase [Candidimonas nitroreducens]